MLTSVPRSTSFVLVSHTPITPRNSLTSRGCDTPRLTSETTITTPIPGLTVTHQPPRSQGKQDLLLSQRPTFLPEFMCTQGWILCSFPPHPNHTQKQLEPQEFSPRLTGESQIPETISELIGTHAQCPEKTVNPDQPDTNIPFCSSLHPGANSVLQPQPQPHPSANPTHQNSVTA